MAAEGEANNPAGGGGGGDTSALEAAAAAAAAAALAEEAAQVAMAQGMGQEHVGEMANQQGADGGGGAGDKDDLACRDLVIVEDAEVVAVEDPEEGTAPCSCRNSARVVSRDSPLRRLFG